MLWSVLIHAGTVILSFGDVSFLFSAGCYMYRRQVRYHWTASPALREIVGPSWHMQSVIHQNITRCLLFVVTSCYRLPLWQHNIAHMVNLAYSLLLTFSSLRFCYCYLKIKTVAFKTVGLLRGHILWGDYRLDKQMGTLRSFDRYNQVRDSLPWSVFEG